MDKCKDCYWITGGTYEELQRPNILCGCGKTGNLISNEAPACKKNFRRRTDG